MPYPPYRRPAATTAFVLAVGVGLLLLGLVVKTAAFFGLVFILCVFIEWITDRHERPRTMRTKRKDRA